MRTAALVRRRTVALENGAGSRILVWRSTSADRALEGIAIDGRRCEQQCRGFAAVGGWHQTCSVHTGPSSPTANELLGVMSFQD